MMFEKFRRSRQPSGPDNDYNRGADFQRGDGYADDTTATQPATVTRTAVADHDYDGDGRTDVADRRPAGTRTVPAGATAAAAPATVAEARAIQRERFGGADGTAIFFGWLSALGLAALLLAVVAAAGTRLGFATGVTTSDATSNAGTIGIVGAAITLVLVLVGTLLAAVAGGKAGDRYHARVDATAWDRDRI